MHLPGMIPYASFFARWAPWLQGAFQSQEELLTPNRWMQVGTDQMDPIQAFWKSWWTMAPSDSPRPADTFQILNSVWNSYLTWAQNIFEMMVPQTTIKGLQQRIDDLEEKVARQTAVIESLEQQLGRMGSGSDEITHRFQEMIQDQGRQFKELSDSFRQYVDTCATQQTPRKDTGEQ